MSITYKDKIIDMNIVELIKDRVNKLTDEHWSKDKCKPQFIVSILYDRNIRDKMEQYIILTCIHLSSSVSSVLFPVEKNIYGYDSILSEMEDLYNQTM
jgi:hypothetical protein